MKSILRELFAIALSFRPFRILFEILFNAIREKTTKTSYKNISLEFFTPTRLNDYRVKTFESKEPETLEWIDSFPEGAVLWDIGANIGLYSVYVAKARKANVFAFEPSVFNLELLAKNIFTNNVSSLITLIPLPLNNRLGVSKMQMSSTELGGALSTFEHKIGWDGARLDAIFEYSVLGVTMDYASETLKIAQPDYIKIDVDGIEHLLLSGGKKVLSQAKGILIEVNDSFAEQADSCASLLSEAGFLLLEKRHSEEFDRLDAFGDGTVWNQIWIKSQ